jgi:hypothetical protein
VGSRGNLTGTSLERRGTYSTREGKVTLPVVIKHGELKVEMMATGLHVSIVTGYIIGNVNISLVISVVERGMPHEIVVSRLFVTPIGSKAISMLIV